MTIDELLQPISALSHADKFRLVRLLLEQLAREDGVEILKKDASEPIFDPRPFFGAGQRTHEEIETHLAEAREGWL